jgi:hypothetical protein
MENSHIFKLVLQYKSLIQIHDFPRSISDMVIQIAWVFISVAFSLLKLKIKYLPASKWNIVNHFSPKKIPCKKHPSTIPSWSFKCFWLYIWQNNNFYENEMNLGVRCQSRLRYCYYIKKIIDWLLMSYKYLLLTFKNSCSIWYSVFDNIFVYRIL